jgi:hypothetical protein
LCELIIKQIAISCQISKYKLKLPFAQIDETKKKKIDMGSPCIPFFLFFSLSVAGSALFQEKKN